MTFPAHRSNWSRWITVVIFSIAMAWVESAVVYYLRTHLDRLEPHQANPLPLLGSFGPVELVRELATLIMLWTVGLLAGRTWRERLGYTCIAFGVWDIFYYVFLKVMCGWPHSLLDWDILFLLPLPWWGPVLAPMLIASLMIIWGALASQFEPKPRAFKFGAGVWIFSLLGAMLALYVFMADAIHAVADGVSAVRAVLPTQFNWSLFGVALVLMATPIIEQIKCGRRNPITQLERPAGRPSTDGA